MTKVIVNPGICGLITKIEAIASEDQTEVTLHVECVTLLQRIDT